MGLGGWMECRQEGVVLHQQEDGVQVEAWRLSIPRPILTCTIAMLDTTTACTVWWSLGLHRRSITAAITSTNVVRARSLSEKAAGVRSRIEAARDIYVQRQLLHSAHGGRLFISGTRMAKLLAQFSQTDRHR